MPRSRSKSRSRSRSASSSPRRSRSPISDHEGGGNDRPNEFRIHIAELPQGVQESEIRKVFQRYGTLIDVWVASASCFAFVVYKQKEEAQKAIDQMDGRSFGTNRVKVTWARPRTRNRSQRYDPNMRCYKCGLRGHFSRDCERLAKEGGRSARRRDGDYGRFSSANSNRYSRSRSPYSPAPLPAPAYFRHGMPMYPSYSRRYDDYMGGGGYYPPAERSNGHEHRYRERGTRLTPPSTSARYNRR